MSRSVITPCKDPSSTTSRWRKRPLAMSSRASSTGISGETVVGLVVMRSRTFIDSPSWRLTVAAGRPAARRRAAGLARPPDTVCDRTRGGRRPRHAVPGHPCQQERHAAIAREAGHGQPPARKRTDEIEPVIDEGAESQAGENQQPGGELDLTHDRQDPSATLMREPRLDPTTHTSVEDAIVV